MSALPDLETSIQFCISVPDWEPAKATPFQGFAYSLCNNSRLIEFIQQFPSNIFELTPDHLPHRIARRICGLAPIRWYGQSPRALKAQSFPEQLAFTIIFLDPSESYAEYEAWVEAIPAPITVVATDGGHIRYSDLSFDAVRSRLLSVCEILKGRRTLSGIEEAHKAISSWVEMPEQKLAYEIWGHGSIAPNVAALRVAGYQIWNVEPLKQFDNEKLHVEQINRTAKTVFDVRETFPFSRLNQVYPRTLDLNLYCPATYELKSVIQFKPDVDREDRKQFLTAIRVLENQTSYSYTISSQAQIKAVFGFGKEDFEWKEGPKPNPAMLLRQREVWLGTEVMASLSSSEMSAVVRLPNRMNRTKGTVRQFAQNYRSDRPQTLKRAELFRGVQKALSEAFPAEFYDLLERSKDGMRVIADAHIEWLNVRGIPLGLRYNVARIPVTPGNAFVSNMASLQPIIVEPDDLLKILVISGLRETDDIAKPFEVAFETFGRHWRDKLDITYTRVETRQELIDAMNSFEGMIMLFDGHGSHNADDPGVIWLDVEAVDVWKLRGEVRRVPPIIILSACDTHAADRNHATVANGFLALGCRSVLGSVFPLHAVHAAIFAARLLYRVADYIPAANKFLGRSVTWLEVVSGMLRRQLATDILRHLESKALLAHDIRLHFEILSIIDTPRDDPFDDMREVLLGKGIEATQFDDEIYMAVASSSTISYLHLGRPETIIINKRDNIARSLGVGQ